MTWSPARYLTFEAERTRPVVDLLAHVPTDPVRSAVDLGCGPGNSTEVLIHRFPGARVTALDSSPEMVAVFDQMAKMRGYVDENAPGRDWNLATAMVMNGEAAFQIMGDWAKGEFLAAGKVPGEDFLCESAPGEGYLYNVDSFAMFEVDGEDKKAGQELLAKLSHCCVEGLGGDSAAVYVPPAVGCWPLCTALDAPAHCHFTR